MNFPAGPINGQTTTINGIVYVYDSTKTAWKRSTSFGGNLTIFGNITSANVVTGNVYTSGGIYWSNNGAAYSSGGGGASNFLYTASATAPVSPTKGDQWFNTTDGTLYEYIDDGDSFQWVDIQTPTLSSDAIVTALAGDVSTSGNISGSTIIITSGIQWSNGTPFASSVYSNANVTAYLTTATGNIAAGNIFTDNYLFANGVNILSSVPTAYSNANVTAYLTTSTGNIAAGNVFSSNYRFANGVNILTTVVGTYSNTNVAAYLTQGANIGSGTTTGNLVAAATTVSTSSITGALVVAGGAGIAGRLNVAGNIVAAGGTNSTNTTTGALVVTGGVGVSGNVYANALRTATGVYWAGNNVPYGSQFDFTSSSTTPASPTVGDFWYYTTDQILFQYINDGTTDYWVDVQTAPLSANIVQEIFVGNTTISGNMTISGNTTIETSIVENVYTVVDAPGVSITPNNGTMQLWTLGASRTPTTTFSNGQSMTLMITAGAYSITWSTMGVSWITGVAPVLSTSTITVVEFWKAGGILFGGLVGTI